MQYCKSQVHPPKQIFSSFLQTTVTKYKYKCTGLKVCEYLDENLRYSAHLEVTEELWNAISHARRSIQLVEEDITKRNALRLVIDLEAILNYLESYLFNCSPALLGLLKDYFQ